MKGGLVVGVVLVGLAGACGGDDEPSSPSQLISGSITGDFDGEAFEAEYGVLIYNGSRSEGTVLFGTSPIRCSAQNHLEVAGIYVEFPVIGEITEGGSTGGSHTFARVTETMVPEIYMVQNGFVGFDILTETSLAGTASGGGTDIYQEHFFSMEGSFEILRCPM